MGSQTMKTGQRKVRFETFRFVSGSLTTAQTSNTTAITEGTYHCTAALTGTGVLAIQLNSDKVFARVPVVTANAEHASSKLFCVVAGNTTGGLITLNCFSDAGTATSPTAWHVTVIGSDAVDQV